VHLSGVWTRLTAAGDLADPPVESGMITTPAPKRNRLNNGAGLPRIPCRRLATGA
jgi:hypothetical protein